MAHRRDRCHFGFFGPLPPDFAIASDDMLVDRSIVTAGGVITAKRPHLARKTRRSVVTAAGEVSRGSSAMAVAPLGCENTEHNQLARNSGRRTIEPLRRFIDDLTFFGGLLPSPKGVGKNLLMIMAAMVRGCGGRHRPGVW